MTMTLLEIMRTSSVIPVIAIDDPEHAVPLARALVAGGIRVLEVTLRTKHGLEAIRAMSEVPGAIVGVGTLTRPEEFVAGARCGRRLRRLARPDVGPGGGGEKQRPAVAARRDDARRSDGGA